ncbi:alpha/beta hydrolase [Mesorhizobium sp. 1B3]|uniref:alpha/beta hydrolase n=1 Tax=Mesorhizobium sp. 1B3 TaxID=3243599 RepID=UPI003D96DEFD
MASFVFKVIRNAFGIAEHVAPGLCGRAAFELFCRTPNPRSLTAGEQRAVDQAARFMAEARRHCLTTRKGRITVFDFKPQGGTRPLGTILVLHGWRSRTEYMKSVIEGFRDAGYRVVSLDLPGHGQSSGRRLNMALAVDAVRVAGEWFGPFAAVAGHSFGGAVAVNAAVGAVAGIPPLATARLVLISAPSSMPAIFEDFGRFLNLGPRSQLAVAAEVERVTGRRLEDFVGSVQLATVPIPALVIHAPDDREVSADDAKAFARAGDHVRLFWARGLGHRRILFDPEVVSEAVGFVTARPRLARVN